MKDLLAKTTSNIKTIHLCQTIYVNSFGNELDVPFFETGVLNNETTFIKGNPQTVMALIGLLSDHGEDSLISVEIRD